MSNQKKSLRTVGSQAKELATYAKQFMLPIECEGRPIVSPSAYPSQVCARHIHKVIDVSSATPAHANGFTVCMFPDLYNPGFITTPSAVNVPSGGAGIVSLSGDLFVKTGSVTDAAGWLQAVDASSAPHKLILSNINDTVPVTKTGVPLVPGPAANVTLNFKNRTSLPTLINFFQKSGGVWSAATLFRLGAFAEVSSTILLALNADAIAFEYTGGTSEMGVRFSLCGSVQATASVGASFTPAFEKFIVDSGITAGRVVSMSILATNTSPEIANGGNVNAGRVPHTFHPIRSVAQDLSSLPENRRYQGPASQGAYVNWVSSQFDEYEVDSLEEKRLALQKAEYLLIEVAGWNPPVGSTASFRLQFDWIVEFYTPNQLFEKSLCPRMTTEFEMLYHLILAMDAATCNPGHLDGLRQLLGSGVKYVQKGMKFYGEHEAVIKSTLSLLMAMLA